MNYMKNKILLESLASDLKRVALGLHRGSSSMTKRFSEEALARNREIEREKLDGYLVKLLERMEKTLRMPNTGRKAEDALMYSTLLQNYALKRCS